MIQKKVCMVGVSGAGKTSLVMQFVHSKFSTKYHSTVGVKIDRKTVELNGESITLVLWDVAGKDPTHEIPASYLRGSHGIILVVDGTRRDTWEQLPELDALVRGAAGVVPTVVALNKSDLVDAWSFQPREEDALSASRDVVRTSALSGAGVEDLFLRVTRGMVAGSAPA